MNAEQIAKLKELAQAADKEVIRSHGWTGSIEMLETLRIDEEYLVAASPAAILELIALAERALLAAAPAPSQQAPQATLICPTCGKDRFKEPCPNMADECPMIADAHLLAPPALAGSQVQAAGDVPWRVVEFWSSANPGQKCLMLAKYEQELSTWGRRSDFIRWCSPDPKATKKPNADCSGEPANCPDNEGYGCACDPMNKAAMQDKP